MQWASRILRRGLRATLAGNEPMFLPPEVFLAHPQWHGAECQLLVISQSPYWCPDLIRHLRKKMEIMLDHWQEAEDMYPSE